MHTYGFYFARPLWLIALVILVPIVWLAVRNMRTLTRLRYVTAIILRCLIVIILVYGYSARDGRIVGRCCAALALADKASFYLFLIMDLILRHYKIIGLMFR